MSKGKAVQRNVRRDQLNALATVMRTPQGRSYMYDLLARCHVYSSSFNTLAMQMAFYEGERNIGIIIGADLTEADTEAYHLMLKEAEHGRRDAERQREPRDGNGHDDSGDGDTAYAE